MGINPQSQHGNANGINHHFLEWGHTQMLGVVPKFSETPGSVGHAGPRVGEHNLEVYWDWLGYTDQELQALAEKGII